MTRLSTAVVCAFTTVVPVGCGLFSPSDQGEPVAAVTQTIATNAPSLSALAPIIPASKVSTGYLPWASSVSPSGGYESSISLDVPLGRCRASRSFVIRGPAFSD